MNGVIIVNKGQGTTSFQLVRTVRKLTNMKKVGHAGTLDPNAEGVLPVLVGHATKLEPYLHNGTKSYTAELTFGIGTDTEDIWGSVTETADTASLDPAAVEAAILSFEGGYLQTPPMYSAKKVHGEKLYDLARNGQTVEREPVRVELSDISVLSVDLPKVTFSVTCSKGTYIRTLCKDIGEKLRIPSCMSGLVRTRHGQFTIGQARTEAELKALAAEGRLAEALIPLESFFETEPRFDCVGKDNDALMNGNKITFDSGVLPEGGRVRMYDASGRFQAIYRFDGEQSVLMPELMFLQKEEGE